jgi:hypothetical protein
MIDVTHALTTLRATIPGIRNLKARQDAYNALDQLHPVMSAVEEVRAAQAGQIATQQHLINSLTQQLAQAKRALVELTRMETP